MQTEMSFSFVLIVVLLMLHIFRKSDCVVLQFEMEEQGVKRLLDPNVSEENGKRIKVSDEKVNQRQLLESEVHKESDVGNEVHDSHSSNSQKIERMDTTAVVEFNQPAKENADYRPSLLDLNDDCLYEVFSHLMIYDLANVANTCVRFRSCAKYVFQQYGKCFMDFDYRPNTGCLNHVEVVQAIRIFGPQAKEIAFNASIFFQLFSEESPLSEVNKYCNNLDKITLNNLQFTKWFPAKYIDFMKRLEPDSDDSVDYDSDDDREWHVGDVAPRFLTNLPKVKHVVINKKTLFCGGRLFEDWKNDIETIAMKDVLVGDGFLKAFRNVYDEIHLSGHAENRTGRKTKLHSNFRIVDALFKPKKTI